MELFSNFETTVLEHQIDEKVKKIAELKKKGENVEYLKLSGVDRKKLVRHYTKKLKFYALQDTTKWQSWPVKPPLELKTKTDKKTRNFKKRQKRRDRRTKHDAKKALESGSVVILVDDEVPAGAIAVLGKVLGFVSTPTIDKHEKRLNITLLRSA